MKFLGKLRKKAKGNKGFTLIELIIVIAIIAILLALLVPNLMKFLGTANKTASSANAKTAFTNAQTWATDLYTEKKTINKDAIITIDKGTVSNTGSGLIDADVQKIKTYFNADEIKAAVITITMGENNAVKSTQYKEGTNDQTYPASGSAVN